MKNIRSSYSFIQKLALAGRASSSSVSASGAMAVDLEGECLSLLQGTFLVCFRGGASHTCYVGRDIDFGG